ncbi:hypothetical protein BX666DRAFT_2031884 [Dichotomocladium elegans]|nr:hypothetical protein BX666DRAFT_2031884 [Dichotomocladium elegans]
MSVMHRLRKNIVPALAVIIVPVGYFYGIQLREDTDAKKMQLQLMQQSEEEVLARLEQQKAALEAERKAILEKQAQVHQVAADWAADERSKDELADDTRDEAEDTCDDIDDADDDDADADDEPLAAWDEDAADRTPDAKAFHTTYIEQQRATAPGSASPEREEQSRL